MKVLTNTRCSDMKKALVYCDSHDLHYEFKVTQRLTGRILMNEWDYLLKSNSESDVLFFIKPFDDTWKSNEIRETNARYKNNRRIGLHMFWWKYKDITNVLDVVKQQNFDFIQITPCQGIKENNNRFWIFYQPLAMRFVDNPMGNKEELKELCKKAKELGITVVADVIMRHVAGNNRGELKPSEKVDEKLLPYILNDKINCDNYEDRWKYTNLCTGMPMMNIWDEEYQKVCRDFLDELIDIGITGIRLDQLMHYPTRNEGCSFLKNVFEPYEDKFDMIYGEIIFKSKEINDLYINY